MHSRRLAAHSLSVHWPGVSFLVVMGLVVQFAWVAAFPPGAAASADRAGSRAIGVAPFTARIPLAGVGSDPVPDVAQLLARELRRKSGSRVVSPKRMNLGEEDAAWTSASGRVRRWADLNQLDSVVVGRAERARAGGLNVDVELCSGHSGAARAEYRLEPGSDPELPAAVEKLATLILADLGVAGVEVASSSASATHEVQTGNSSGSPESSASDEPKILSADGSGDAPQAKPKAKPQGESRRKSNEQDEESGVSLMPGAKSDDPISIKSEELEVVPVDGGRRLVFSRNVVVIQGDIELRADRLEAIYPEGASRPETLIAEGHVVVEQGDRHARCEKATYERKLRTIVCSGKAEVVQGCDLVRGREIEFDLERERVRVTGAASVLIRSGGDGAGDDCETSTQNGIGAGPERKSQSKALAQDKARTQGESMPEGLLN